MGFWPLSRSAFLIDSWRGLFLWLRKSAVPPKDQKNSVEGCGVLVGENPAAFPQARPIFQQPFSLPESAQTLAGIAFRAAGKSGNHFQQRRNLPENLSSREFRTATAFSSFLKKKNPKPRRIKSNSKVTKKRLSGSPQSNPKVASKVTFRP